VNDRSATANPGVNPAPGLIAVLLVDDQRFVGMAVERLLAGEPDIKVHCCVAATEAVARATAIAPALIFQDLEMPDLDGLTLVGRYRSEPALSGTAIVVLSGNDDAASRSRAIAAGANDYLVKLPDKQTLVACIRRHAQHEPITDGPNAEVTAAGADDLTLDRSVLSALRAIVADDDTSAMTMFIDQFLAEATAQMNCLAQAALRRDVAAMKTAAHTLKGSALTMGARRLGKLSGNLETAAGHVEGNATGALTSIVADMREELVRVRAECLEEGRDLRR
jgi:CheY-like chemotaxis protein/HPt (histidine-containing phosphotransfer) domain-containing protein